MKEDRALTTRKHLARIGLEALPAIAAQAGKRADRKFIEFFTANIRNRNTRIAYARAVANFFDYCDERGLRLSTIEPVAVAAYIENLAAVRSAPTVKQNLAAIRMLFDWLRATGITAQSALLHSQVTIQQIRPPPNRRFQPPNWPSRSRPSGQPTHRRCPRTPPAKC